MTECINDFLNERKELWLKDRLKKAENETVVAELQQQANDKFSLNEWLPDAAKRVTQLSMVSHPSKFSHPSAKTSSVIAKEEYRNDGYLRSGNVDYPLHVFGNAAAMDVFKFLSLPLTEKLTVLEGFEQQNEDLKTLLMDDNLDFESFSAAFLKIKATDTSVKTDHLVKQVYFPIDQDEYHLLSILTPSGLVTRLKQTIDEIRFSEETKRAKELRKKNEHHEIGYADIFDLTITAYGGTQPQNVSVLNSQNAGRAYLLSSCPPVFEKRKVRLPSLDFFKQCLYWKAFRAEFESLQRLISEINNQRTREKIEKLLHQIVGDILFIAFCVRKNEKGWSRKENYHFLTLEQKIWLDDAYLEQRETEKKWQEEIAQRIAKWILGSFEEFCDSKSFSSAEIIELKSIVFQALDEDKEFF
ncbi:type I-F CRISPR-associated protein Csy1 [Acinetobacter bereziniae]|uniref:type I-F CRISPR-associated protein Csy1 n=1 Tax=Acinetobacter bereziniae TaxID=106648 RepID=UPI0015811001|nr:type I-F CRISPR-associated protein Csy1 [Acinetobacter bereziniae]NUF62176.1 type I-F CRISPR-associated protein Csy1 [Acinetobacter bereziniae]NUG05941.1 type I-F CRISPR-associated protein Csy1 [Acinetobacter bereziniae]NUG63092.1 type I-F CRISPR-associated protein Csy1 [Acinetobacter bereziniae]NUG69927.1 type I-F CRISPR-associated protein Csy1 [Acinetobacter bereziniae]NUG81508.1 type I-F CRISPR-associated protein Csy1 [Acinetobacter bereziniae]